MRRASTCLAVAGLALLALAGVAEAAPTVTFKAEAVPIPGYKGTGLKFGAGAAVKAEYQITGTEYAGSPPPLKEVLFYLPTGTKLHPSGFKTCPKSVLEPAGQGPKSCPAGSAAGPVGAALGFVDLSENGVPTRIKEPATIESFYAEGGGLEFFTYGHAPVAVEILSTGHYTNLNGGEGFGPKLIAEVPLVATLPGAPYVSVETIKVQAGSAIGPKNNPKKDTYYGRVPKKCPKGYFPVKSTLKFYAVEGLPEQEVTKEYKAPCPKK